MNHDSPSGAGLAGRLSNFARRHAATAIVAAIGIGLGTLLFAHAYGGQRRRMIDDFRRYTEERVSVLDWHLRTHALALDSMRRLFDASYEVERQEFRAFVQPLLKHDPEMISLGWAPKVPAEQLREYEQSVRDEGIGEFCIISAQGDQRPDDGSAPKVYFPAHYLEPEHNGMIPLGHDLASSPAVAQALRWSRDTNNMVAIGPVVLGHPDSRESGIVVALPVYGSGPSIESVEDRRANLAGYVFQAYALEDAIAHALALLPAEGIDLAVFALSESGEEQLVAFHSSRLRRTPVAFVASQWADRRGDLREVVDLPIPGGELLVVARPTPGFIAAQMNWHPWMLLVITLALTGLMVTYIQMVRARRERVESLAAELAESNESLLKEIDDRRRAEQELRKRTYDLGERVKELKCLYGISALMEQPDISLAEIAQGVADLIPPAWQYPEITCARVALNDQEYKTDGFAESPSGQTCEIVAHGETLGSVAVYYLQERPECDEGPFLKEERDLITAIAERLARFTERKQAQAQLEEAKDAAEAASRAKTFFLANMSHEIRTPLTAILGFSEMLTDSSNSPDEQREWLDAISRNAEHLLLLVSDVLDVSKIEADKLELTCAPCSLVSLIAQVASMLRPRAQQQGLDLAVDYKTPLPETITADEAHLRQALVNLVGNAIKFTDDGSVTVTTSFLPDGLDGEPAVRIDVADTGVGIDSQHLEHLFDSFYQADVSVSRKHAGTGLGLAITRHIVEMMDGVITVASTPQAGSVFSVVVPTGPLAGVAMLWDPEEIAERAAAFKALARQGRRLDGVRVLLAEDGPDNQRLISALLERAGASVVVIANGRLAVQQAQADTFDVVLMDIQMPEMDGYQATRLLRQHGYEGPIVALTAHVLSDVRDECLAAGCTDYLTKPINRDHLIGAVAFHTGRVDESAPATGRPAATGQAPGDLMSQFADEEQLVEVIGHFVDGLIERTNDMHEAINGGFFDRLGRLAHQLTGSGGSYGYPKITDLARQVERTARAEDSEGARLAVAQLRQFCQAVSDAWRRRTARGARR